MDIDSQKCPDCGKPFQSPTGAEAVCECGKSTLQPPPQPEAGIVYLLPCPKCGDQKHTKASMIGKAEQCQCGYEFRYTLVLSPIRPEPVGWMQTIQHHSTVCTQRTLQWWRQSAAPWIKRTVTYIREHVTPGIAAASISAWNWLADSVGSFFNPPPRNESHEQKIASPPTFRPIRTPMSATPIHHVARSLDSTAERESREHVSSVTLASQIAINNPASESPESQWQKYRTLAQQMLDAKNYHEAYKYASSALELVPTEPFCWAIKGVASAYLSTPPDFRYDEMVSCLTVAIKSDDVLKIVPVLQKHIWDAAKNYRNLAWDAKQQAYDDARKEGLSDSVDVGLQLTMRNFRVDAAQVKKHQPGYLLSIRAILYARELHPSLMASKKALTEIETDLHHSWIATFKDDGGNGSPYARIEAARDDLIADIKQVDPTFQPPERPRPAGCFIATAATGDANHPYVTELRLFRDTCLTTTKVGRRAIHGYYRFSPRFADIIAKRAVLRRLVYLGIVCPTALAARAMLRIRTSVGRSGSD
jgi:hypothetical protein